MQCKPAFQRCPVVVEPECDAVSPAKPAPTSVGGAGEAHGNKECKVDIKCRKCGEPWDMDCIHEEIAEQYPEEPWKREGKYIQELYDPYYNDMRNKFIKEGCKAFGAKCNPSTKANPEWQVAYELMGDDLDGVASIMEDMGL